MENTSTNKLILIQCLRGLAAIIVVFHHVTGQAIYVNRNFLGNIFLAGWSGVDFFFVLSGFIIYYIHHKDIGNPHRLKQFISKRFIRVYPIYWLVCLMIIPLFFVFQSFGSEENRNITVILKSIFLFPQSTSPIVRVAWSMSYEILFYFIFSLLIAMKNKRLSFTITGIWITGILINLFHPNLIHNNFYLNFVFSNYCLEFLFGVITSYTLLNFKNIKKYKYIFMIIGIILFCFSWVGVLNNILIKNTPASIISLGLSASLIVLGASSFEFQKTNNILKVALYLGDASYSIYLVHVFCISIFFKVLNPFLSRGLMNFPVMMLIITFLSILSGCIFHSVFEKPLLKYLRSRLKIGSSSKRKEVA